MPAAFYGLYISSMLLPSGREVGSAIYLPTGAVVLTMSSKFANGLFVNVVNAHLK